MTMMFITHLKNHLIVRLKLNRIYSNKDRFDKCLFQSALPINGVHRAIMTAHSATMAVSVTIRLVIASALQDSVVYTVMKHVS